MLVREAARRDLDAIVALLADDPLGAAREAPGDAAYASAFDRITADPDETLLVAEIDGAVAGCLQLSLLRGLSRRAAVRAQIEGVRVAAGRRGAGVGAALMAAALERARDAGAVLAQLTSDKSRPDALRFYEGLGFVASHEGFKRPL